MSESVDKFFGRAFWPKDPRAKAFIIIELRSRKRKIRRNYLTTCFIQVFLFKFRVHFNSSLQIVGCHPLYSSWRPQQLAAAARALMSVAVGPAVPVVAQTAATTPRVAAAPRTDPAAGRDWEPLRGTLLWGL